MYKGGQGYRNTWVKAVGPLLEPNMGCIVLEAANEVGLKLAHFINLIKNRTAL